MDLLSGWMNRPSKNTCKKFRNHPTIHRDGTVILKGDRQDMRCDRCALNDAGVDRCVSNAFGIEGGVKES